MRVRHILTAAAMLAASVAGAARAGELTFYEEPGFGGGQLQVRDVTPNMQAQGFNDRAQSLVVHSGRWQVCTDADFRGQCMELTPGQYGGLDGTFNRRISSAREIGDNRGGYAGGYGRDQARPG